MTRADPITETMREIAKRAGDRSTSARDLTMMRSHVTRIGYAIPPLSGYGKVSMAIDCEMNAAIIDAQRVISEAVKRHRDTIMRLVAEHAPDETLEAVVGLEEAVRIVAEQTLALNFSYWLHDKQARDLVIDVDDRVMGRAGTVIPSVTGNGDQTILDLGGEHWYMVDLIAVSREANATRGLVLMFSDETIVKIRPGTPDDVVTAED